MTKFDVDLFVIGAGSGGVRAARIAAGYGARVTDRGGVSRRRHLRHPRLRAQEALRLRRPFADEFEDAAGFGWTRARGPLRLRQAYGCEGQGDRPSRRCLHRERSSAPAWRWSASRAAHRGSQHRAASPTARGSRPGRSWSPPAAIPSCPTRFPASTSRALQRAFRMAEPAALRRGGRRRLHRRRVRLRLRRAGLGGHHRRSAARRCCAASTRTCATALTRADAHGRQSASSTGTDIVVAAMAAPATSPRR